MTVVEDRMATEQDEAKAHGRYVKELRLDAGFNRPETVGQLERFGVTISPVYLQKIEEGRRPLRGASLPIREALRALYKVEPERWEADTGLSVPRAVTRASAVSVPVLGQATPKSGEGSVLFDPKALPKDVRELQNLRYMVVDETFMYAENMFKPIPVGSSLLLELSAPPFENDVVVAQTQKPRVYVVKQFSQHGTAAYLRSYHASGPSFWEDERASVLGVVRVILINP